MRRILLSLLLSCLMLPAVAQTKQIKDLKNQRAKIEQGIQTSKKQLTTTKTKVIKREKDVDYLAGQLQQRLAYIHQLEQQLDSLGRQVDALERELKMLTAQLNDKRQRYTNSLRYARLSPSLKNPILFIFSGRSFAQIYRRMRYAREFAALQRTLGLQIISKQNQVRNKQSQLLATKQEMNTVLAEVMRQRKELAAQHSVAQNDVIKLKKKQKEIESQVAVQQKQLTALTKKIDELVAYEIEQARKRAEAEAKAKAKGQTTPSKTQGSSSGSRWLTAEDRQLNGSLEQNRGRLPVPITGQYRISRHYGANQLAKDVVLDNKGTNYQGQSGARARSIFDGVVSAIFQLGGTKNILVRHGSYISVYCNLSSVIVQKGQKVKARDLLGTVAADDKGNYILHFQLRKETAKLNPEQWIGR